MKTWQIGEMCVLGRTSQTFWVVAHILSFESGGQYGLIIKRMYRGKIVKKMIAVEKAIPRKRIN